MKIKTSELTGPALDWAVAKCEERRDATQIRWDSDGDPLGPVYDANCNGYPVYEPSADWSQGGPIIERERIGVTATSMAPGFAWEAHCIPDEGVDYYGYGPTPLIAAMRCYVASRLGDEVEVPDELCAENRCKHGFFFNGAGACPQCAA